MADLPSSARVVVIGGGAVGCSILYHLTRAGWSDVVLLEKSELTAGSTWHAAGNCPTFAGNWLIMQMQAYSIDLFSTLGDEVGYPINYHQTGAVRIAHTDDRMREFAHVADMARSQGRVMEMMGLDDLKSRVPQMELHDLKGGLWDPLDGDIDPSQLTQAYATGARKGGARIIRGCPVTGIDRNGEDWVIRSGLGDIGCRIVINATGYYAPDVAAMFLPHGGRMPPQIVMAHQYLVTEEIPDLQDAPGLPMIRDPDSSYYLRQEKHGLLLGPYENGGRIHWQGGDDIRPDDFSFQLFPDDLGRIESYIEDACERVPLLGSVGLQRVINGPIPYAPDGLPLVGPMPGVPNAFEAMAFTFGIVQSGGAGKIIADYITEGEPEWDAWSVDPRRFTGFADAPYAAAKGKEIYDHEYAMGFPHLQWPEGRNKRLSAIQPRLAEQGAVFGPFAGWERPVWFSEPGDNTDPQACATWDREGPWFNAVARECTNTRDAAGLLDLTGLTHYHLSGEGAATWLESRIAGGLPKPGRIRLGYFSSPKGRFAAEMTITRRAEDDFILMTAAIAEWKDLALLRNTLPAGLSLENTTRDMGVMLVTGPKARQVLEGVIEADLTKGWLTHQTARVNGQPFDLLRLSFVGELGWELHMPAAIAADAFDRLMHAGAPHGLKPFGMYAMESMRIEKGYLHWGNDLNADYTLAELGVPNTGPASRRMVSMIVEPGRRDAPGLSSIWQDGARVGLVSSAAFGHRTGQAIALGMVENGVEGAVEIDVFGDRLKAVIQPSMTLYDPANDRIKA
ncbi:FAD-dependent oxidoreductase [Rhodophyticola sp. CCM32]|uniref:GcvT family protein n=1 Tax=Rhodophyticola sp. CCM32 TaxID=2916397 RepID=UPI00107F1332|nr:FAD-dependent oxidoreductase [Rhodophyticola sp. CCM32]QBX99898.1 FAD-dependent oxidoreductase [Rhodophyticola sp. CCM32]